MPILKEGMRLKERKLNCPAESFSNLSHCLRIDLFQTDGGVRIEGRMETGASEGVPIFGEEECLKERKWWCFLLSSIFTFLLGIFSVLLVRLLQAAFCKEVCFLRSNQFISDSR